MGLMYMILVIGLVLTGIGRQTKYITNSIFNYVGISLLCIIWYIFTITFIGNPSVSIQHFCIFTIAAFLLPGIVNIDTRIFLLSLLIIPSIGILYFDQIILNSISEEGVLSMGKCYAMLVPVLANIVYLRFFFKKEKIFMRILILPFTIINIFYLMQITIFGSRGPILCAFLLFVACLIIEVTVEGHIKIHKERMFVILIGIIVLIFFFIPILQTVSDFLQNYDVHINFVDKFLRLNSIGDIDNGRRLISAMTIKGFFEAPLLGHGIAQFENNTGESYPHNFLLQMLYDGGIVLTGGILIPICRSIIKKIRNVNSQEAICLILLFFASVPGAMFSGDLWNTEILWLFFGFVLKGKSI